MLCRKQVLGQVEIMIRPQVGEAIVWQSHVKSKAGRRGLC